MLTKINYLLTIKFWLINFLKKKQLLSLAVNVYFYSSFFYIKCYIQALNGYSLVLNKFSKKKNRIFKLSFQLKIILLQLFIQKELHPLFKNKLKISFGAVVNLLNFNDWVRVNYMC